MTTKLQELIDLAEEPSSARRRELLHEITDPFFSAPDDPAPEDFAAAEANVRELAAEGDVAPERLVRFLKAGQRTQFLAMLSALTAVDFHTARYIADCKDLDALAIVCKSADLPLALFLTFAVLILCGAEDMAEAEDYGRLYADLPRDVALRALRFWKMRRNTEDEAAA